MAKSSKSSELGPIFGFIIASIFSGLILSVWGYIAKTRGNSYVLQLIFGLLAIVLFGYFVSYKMYSNYSNGGDDGEVILHYIGMTGTYANALAAVIWIATIFKKST